MKSLFLISVLFVVYAYFGYPLLLWIIDKFHRKEHNTGEFLPDIAVIIPIANESSDKITNKILNTQQLNYSKDRVQIVIALDNPNQTTKDVIAEQLPKDCNWKVCWSDSQQGKEKMQKMACDMISFADVVIFTDVSTTLNPDCLLKLTSHFVDPSIGVVDGESKIVSNTGVSSEGVYLKYENKIRELESCVNSQVTAGGCLFAATRDVVEQLFLRPTSSDFTCALVASKLGKRTILDKMAVAMFSDLKDTGKEYNRKHRTILRGINSLWRYREMLNPFKYGFFSFQLWSHKVAKWLTPFALLVALISNIFLISESYVFLLFFVCQIIFYSFAIIGVMNTNLIQSWFKIPVFFTVANVAMFHACIDFLRGKHMLAWKASER